MGTDSNERELLAAVELLIGCLCLLRGCKLTLHFDNMNAALICEKGSPKFRLQKYALYIANLCDANNIMLKTVWIPRVLNQVADFISKTVDYDDFSVTEQFYQLVLQMSGYVPNVDRFANNWNAKCVHFNSPTYCVGSSGVDAFNYHWGQPTLNWLFPPIRLIARTIMHLERCNGSGLLLVPQWKSAAFYPLLMDFVGTSVAKGYWQLFGKNVFKLGADASCCFGPNFTGMVEIWHLDFKK
jgi:hypothetical protein